MEDFKITTCLTAKEYSKIMFIGLYKKAAFILATLLGIYNFTTILLDYLNIINWYSTMPLFEIGLGAILLLAPSLIVLISVNQFKSNPCFQKDIIYTFGESGFSVHGTTFKSDFLWSHIIKEKQLGKFIILYHSKKFGNFIDTTKLTTEQLEFIKQKVNQKTS